MTLCVAAICKGGRNIVCASDGALTDATTGLSADLGASKMMFYGGWLFMFAGSLSNADLIVEELRQQAITDENIFRRENIQTSVRNAYKKRIAKWSADRFLTPYDMEMEEFKQNGLAIFGDERFGELSRNMEQDAEHFNEQVLVVGYGKAEASAMLYVAETYGVRSHALDGSVCIGSGTQVANSIIFSLECGRNSGFEDALYAVLAAKFTAEKSAGVGRRTSAVVISKSNDPVERIVFKSINSSDIESVRRIWEKHGKIAVPKQAYSQLDRISLAMGTADAGTIVRRVQEANASSSSEPEPPPEQSGGAAPQSNS